MSEAALALSTGADLSTRERLKRVAQRLFAEYGVDGVSTRDIVRAAGQKNVASLHYYFGTKERLIEELVIDATVLMEGRRAAALEALLAAGAPVNVRDLVRVIAIGAVVEDEADDRTRTASRFVTALFPRYRHLFEQAIGDRLNRTYQRCLALIRERVGHLAPDALNTRLLFLSLSMMELFAAREAALEAGAGARAYWGHPAMLETMVDALCGMLLAPVSGEAG
jgi:AcrR family transcriptional regulator